MRPFLNRTEAGKKLAEKVSALAGQKGMVLAIPRGGVPVGYEIALKLGWTLEVFLVKKIPHPSNPELAIGAVTPESFLVDENASINPIYLKEAIQQIRVRLQEMRQKFQHPLSQLNLKGKEILITDDGVATGHTILFGLQLIKKEHPARLIVAIPVVSPATLEKIKRIADEVITLITPIHFTGISSFYENFEQLADEEVIRYLNLNRQQHV